MKIMIAAMGAFALCAATMPMEPAEARKSATNAKKRARSGGRANHVRSAPSDSTFANCSAARAAGAAPVRRGDAGYSRKLDRDGDGIGCE